MLARCLVSDRFTSFYPILGSKRRSSMESNLSYLQFLLYRENLSHNYGKKRFLSKNFNFPILTTLDDLVSRGKVHVDLEGRLYCSMEEEERSNRDGGGANEAIMHGHTSHSYERAMNSTFPCTCGGSFHKVIEHFGGVQGEDREIFPHAKLEEVHCHSTSQLCTPTKV